MMVYTLQIPRDPDPPPLPSPLVSHEHACLMIKINNTHEKFHDEVWGS